MNYLEVRCCLRVLCLNWATPLPGICRWEEPWKPWRKRPPEFLGSPASRTSWWSLLRMKERNSARGPRSKSLGLWVGVMQPYQGSQRSCDRQRRLGCISSRRRIVRRNNGGRVRGRKRGRVEWGGNSHNNNGMGRGQKSAGDSEDELELVDEMSHFWEGERVCFGQSLVVSSHGSTSWHRSRQ